MKDINGAELCMGDKVIIEKTGWMGKFWGVKDGCEGEVYLDGDWWIQIHLNCEAIRKYYKVTDKDTNPPTLRKIV